MLVWPYLRVLWFSENDSTGPSKKVDRRNGRKTLLKSGQEWTLPAQIGQLKNNTRWKEIVAKTFVVPRRPCKIMG